MRLPSSRRTSKKFAGFFHLDCGEVFVKICALADGGAGFREGTGGGGLGGAEEETHERGIAGFLHSWGFEAFFSFQVVFVESQAETGHQ